MKLENIDFKPHPSGMAGEQGVVFFGNGYGASVLFGNEWHSDGVSTYELAVLEGDKDNFSVTYETCLTDDVFGYISESEVNKILSKIESLPAKGDKT